MPSWYSRRLLPVLLDIACSLGPVTAQRRKIVPLASGRVVEVGMGTGLNLPFYDQRQVKVVVGVDPGEHMQARVLERSARIGLPVQLLPGLAEMLPLETASFDCVVCTYTLCSVQDPAAALREMRRVLKPGGRLLIAEHGLAPDAGTAWLQRRLEPLWSRIAGGCHLSRDMPALLREAGFDSRLDAGYVSRPHVLGHMVWGQAVPA